MTRGQMAVLLLRAKHGAGYQPPDASRLFSLLTPHVLDRNGARSSTISRPSAWGLGLMTSAGYNARGVVTHREEWGMADCAIPVIDIGPYRSGDPAGTKRVAESIDEACERIGFLVIDGHGVPDALLRRVFDVSLAFFELQTVGFFLHPNYDARVACLPTCTDADRPPRYASILAGEHMLAKLERRETRA